FPAERVAAPSVDGNVLRFDLPSPESVVVWIDSLATLVVLPDPIEAGAPLVGGPGVIDVIERGADPTGHALATMVLQAAIDAAAGGPGGGTVVLPRGVYRSGTLTLKSNVTLYLARGALLQGSSDPADYPIDPGRIETASDTSLPPDVRYLGRTMTFSRLLLIDRAENVRISGRGTIDGDGAFLRTRRNAAPNLLRVRESTNVRVDDVLFRNAAAWSLHVLASRDVAFRNVKVINDRTNLNTDGIDIDMSTDVTIDRAFIHTKDDAVCVKATRNGDLSGDPARINVTNSLVSAVDAGFKIGSETDAATLSDIVFEDGFVFDTGRAMSVVVRDGATVERVTFRRIRVGPNVDHLVEQVIGVRDPEAALGVIRDLAFDDVVAPSFVRPTSNRTWYAQFRPGRPGPDVAVDVFEGADDTHAVDGLRLGGFVVNGQPLRDGPAARDVANLTIGPHVRNVSFD
ncbi:MAG TPA: glycosyl hydrolase family 28 protein, partial [Candidatus Limnocylindrales bacterium]|nr:glycosyl hydrolase family 28 protein [Candidatus Limnocylindrales bacterium]